MWTHKGADFAPHPVIGLVLQVGDAEKFPQALGLESLGQFFWKTASRIRVSQWLVFLKTHTATEQVANQPFV